MSRPQARDMFGINKCTGVGGVVGSAAAIWASQLATAFDRVQALPAPT